MTMVRRAAFALTAKVKIEAVGRNNQQDSRKQKNQFYGFKILLKQQADKAGNKQQNRQPAFVMGNVSMH